MTKRDLPPVHPGERAITADTALPLARFFSTEAQSWMNLQAEFEIETAEITLSDRIAHEVKPFRDAA